MRKGRLRILHLLLKCEKDLTSTREGMDFTPIRRCKLFATLKRIGAISLPTLSLVIWVCFDSSQPLHYAFFIMAKDPR
jgi:hypothetical protein